MKLDQPVVINLLMTISSVSDFDYGIHNDQSWCFNVPSHGGDMVTGTLLDVEIHVLDTSDFFCGSSDQGLVPGAQITDPVAFI